LCSNIHSWNVGHISLLYPSLDLEAPVGSYTSDNCVLSPCGIPKIKIHIFALTFVFPMSEDKFVVEYIHFF
jgi:hypothetical protein